MTEPTELQRRRELARRTKAELIDSIVQIQTAQGQAQAATEALRERVEGDEP